MDINAFFQSIGAWIVNFFNSLVPDYILPNLQLILEVVILLIAAYIVGKISKFIVTKFMSVIGLKKITSKTWAEGILKVTGYRGTVVELIGDMVKWLIYLLFFALIIQTIGLPGVADIFTQIAIFMPRFIGAVLIIVIGFMIADFFGKVFEEAGRRFLKEEVLASLAGGLARYSFAFVIVIMALSLIGIDTASLMIMFAIILSTFMIVFVIGIKDIFPNFTAAVYLNKKLKPGEHIKVGKYSGVVEKIEPLSVTLKNGAKSITIPNSVFINNPIEKIEKKTK